MKMPSQPEFTVFPAIDLRQGQVVRLKEGDPDRQTKYSDNPAGTARQWLEYGACWLHVVNLDGAFGQSGSANMEALRSILLETARAEVPVQFGGGLRSIEAVETIFEMGVARAIIGTLAVEQPEILYQALDRWGPEQIGVSLDARDGRVQVRGWQSDSSQMAVDVALQLKEAGLRWLVFTDISRDGLQTGINLQATLQLAKTSQLNVIASGGVSTIADIHQSRDAGLAGIIVGRALYEGSIDPNVLFSRN